ncbi:MAG: bacteriocin fulvocin C-related protein [Gemmatimonadales bacterium]|nr:bacteriocin fulvocin C-related protein [Gemmatimonadales bacterium]
MRITIGLLLLAPVVAVTLDGPPPTVPLAASESECVRAREWVAANREHLPDNLEAISQYSMAYRRAIYRELPRSTKLALWRAQLEHYGRDRRLNAEQREFLREVDRDIDTFFGPEKVAAAKARYLERARATLGRDLTRDIFAVLGVASLRTGSGRLLSGMKGAFTDCNCSVGSDWCNIMGPACSNNGGCTNATLEGCGWWFCEACNGTCGG